MKNWRLLAAVFFLIFSFSLLVELNDNPPDFIKSFGIIWGDIRSANLMTYLRTHEYLAGWAQFAAVSGGIGLAIFVPMWQRHGQELDRKRESAESKFVYARLSFFIITDLHSHYLHTVLGLALINTVREELIDCDSRDDFLSRIHALEAKDIDEENIIQLEIARNGLLRANRILMKSSLINSPLSADEVNSINVFVKSLEDVKVVLEKKIIKTEVMRDHANAVWPIRVLYTVFIFLFPWRYGFGR